MRPAARGRSVGAFVAAALLVGACGDLPPRPPAGTSGTIAPATAAAASIAVTSPAVVATVPPTPLRTAAPTSPAVRTPTATIAPPPVPTPTRPSATPAPVVLIGAGDIAACSALADARRTAALIRAAPRTAVVFTLGDNAYPNGSAAEFRRCYGRSWGAFRARTHPAAGNHEWNTAGAAGYRGYFGRAVGPKNTTWYAFDAGAWRVIVLDADCWNVGGCGPKSRQGRWLAAELAKDARANPGGCQVALWHQPIASSGLHGDTASSMPLWRAVEGAGVDLVLNGHDHDYERFALLGRTGTPTTDGTGTREFVVGTGGSGLYPALWERPGSEKLVVGRHGVLRLDLGDGTYAWQFLATPRGAVLDSGTGTCH